MKKIIPLRELPLSDDFMFGEIMSREKIAKLFLESLLNKKIARIEYIGKQETIEDSAAAHGVRLDVYLQDDAHTMYNIEIQTVNKYDLERRTRYYQQKIDARTLRKGEHYRDLPDSYIIFVCTFDYFKLGFAVYEKQSSLKNRPDIEFNDGSHVFILNSRFTVNNTSLPIEEFLKFLQTNDSDAPYQSELTREVVSAVDEVRNDTTREGIYMTLAMKMDESREEGRKEERLLALKKMMKNLGLSAEKAMDAMDIPKANQPEYLALLETESE